MNEISNFIIDWFLENTEITSDCVDIYDDYLDNGWIDSFGFLGLVAAIEEKFAIEFEDSDFENRDVFTINGMSRIIEERIHVAE